MALSIAERLREKLAACVVSADGQKISFTVSLGLARYQTGESDFQAAIKRADMALYHAKLAGRNKVCLQE